MNILYLDSDTMCVGQFARVSDQGNCIRRTYVSEKQQQEGYLGQ